MNIEKRIAATVLNIKRYYEVNGHAPSREEARSLGLLLVGKSTLARRFGGWNKFLSAIDVKPINGTATEMVTVNCKECKTEIRRSRAALEQSKSGNFFCSSSCSATYSNPRRNRKPKVMDKCKCGAATRKGKGICRKCLATVRLQRPIRDLYYGIGANRYNSIRGHARVVYRAASNQACRRCRYDKHIHVCHIRAIAEFDDNTPIGVVNDIDNLIGLCPNCHWELDNGIFELPL